MPCLQGGEPAHGAAPVRGPYRRQKPDVCAGYALTPASSALHTPCGSQWCLESLVIHNARLPALHPASWDCTRRQCFLKFNLPLLLTTYRCHLPLTAATTARPSVDCQISYLTPTSTSTIPGPFHYGSLHHLAPHRGGRSQLSRPVFASALSAQGCRVENGFSLSLRSPPLLPPNS